jgi:hypothetical protein
MFLVNSLFNTSVNTTIVIALIIQNLDSGLILVREDGIRYCDITDDKKDDTIVRIMY